MERMIHKDRIIIVLTFFVFWIHPLLFTAVANASAPPLFKVEAKAAVLLDALSGQIIFEQNPQEAVAPASLAKLLTLYLAYDALEMGLVKPEDDVFISEKAWATQGSKMFVEVDKRVAFKKLLEGIASISGNDACVAVAEHLAGLEEVFVARMNEKARSIGMVHSQFKNVNGLPAEDQYTTASDIGILSYHYLNDHPEALAIHSIKEFTFGGITQHNRNGLLWLDEGIDGLKTGWIDDTAGFHLVATAKRDDQRFIAVVMGAKDQRTRENEAFKLLNYGFKNFSTIKLFDENDVIDRVSVWKGKVDHVDLIPNEPGVVTIPLKEGQSPSIMKKIPKRVFAPVKKREKLGEVTIAMKGKLLKEVDLVAQDDVPLGHVAKRLMHQTLLSFIVPPYAGWIMVFILFLFLIAASQIKRKTR